MAGSHGFASDHNHAPGNRISRRLAVYPGCFPPAVSGRMSLPYGNPWIVGFPETEQRQPAFLRSPEYTDICRLPGKNKRLPCMSSPPQGL